MSGLRASNLVVIVTGRLKPDLPPKQHGTYAAIKTVEITEGTQVAFVIDHCGKVGDVHRDVRPERYLLGIPIKQGSFWASWRTSPLGTYFSTPNKGRRRHRCRFCSQA